jgi:2-dehydropantoate 2-reductase
MRHAVLGAGGVGGLVGAALARAGNPVTLIVRNASHPHKLTVKSTKLGDFEVHVQVVTRLERPVDVLWITTKATQLEAALASAPAALLKGTAVPLLNGVDHVARLREVYPKVSPGIIRVEAERGEPGHIVQVGPFIGVDLIGPLAAEIAAELNAAGIDAGVAGDELTMLWSKLVMLAPLALTTAATQRPLGGVRDDPRWRERLLGVMTEAHEVAVGLGARVDPEITRAMLLRAPDGMRSSMQKDRELGRPLELDAIAGPIIRAGRELGIPTPQTAILMSALG